jgi:prepilin-type N-terminal cleavage/methylation domain-containing protein
MTIRPEAIWMYSFRQSSDFNVVKMSRVRGLSDAVFKWHGVNSSWRNDMEKVFRNPLPSSRLDASSEGRPCRGFTLIELLVVMAIISVLMSLLIPSIQSARESARKIQCQSNLKQMGLGLQNFHSTHNKFPAGKFDISELNHSWCLYVLPFLELGPLATRFDLSKPWDEPAKNVDAAAVSLSIFQCPTSPMRFAGGTDYCGITGGTQGGLPFGDGRSEALGSGVLVTVNEATPTYVAYRDVIDGSSNTICISESHGRDDETGRWASGDNLVATDINPVNTPGKLFSFHPYGVHALRADGSAMFISSNIDLAVLGAISTRNGGEVNGE